MLLQESTSKLLDLEKSINTDIGMVRLTLDGFKLEGIKLFTRVFTHIDSLKSQVNFSNDDLVISVRNSYFYFFINVEKSYDKFWHNMHKSLTYFLAKQWTMTFNQKGIRTLFLDCKMIFTHFYYTCLFCLIL